MKLKPTYNAKGEKRAYYLGEDGEEYFMYQDERTGYTIREMNKDDVIPWFEEIKQPEVKNIHPVNRAIYLAKVRQKVDEMIGESIEKTMLIYNPKNEIIGQLDFTENEPGNAKLQIYLKNQKTIQLKGARVIELVRKMNASERLYDEIWLEDDKKNIIKLC